MHAHHAACTQHNTTQHQRRPPLSISPSTSELNCTHHGPRTRTRIHIYPLVIQAPTNRQNLTKTHQQGPSTLCDKPHPTPVELIMLAAVDVPTITASTSVSKLAYQTSTHPTPSPQRKPCRPRSPRSRDVPADPEPPSELEPEPKEKRRGDLGGSRIRR
ncbi:hypothetical protein K458DRAFT_405340 [Lentithecium fluviatile CBS 122367]|uniref:Uncharacterized protein n=1 Tax=Lentithecium fluviatile CBS 122367 TaxID=1168545 RepID=A0A6G1IZ54_9PLEO|nr:hypothetical protein K458DRAFT_405340 [Lentithecium fluviatile CBS 122367]